jgi:hypothetical protein
LRCIRTFDRVDSRPLRSKVKQFFLLFACNVLDAYKSLGNNRLQKADKPVPRSVTAVEMLANPLTVVTDNKLFIV